MSGKHAYVRIMHGMHCCLTLLHPMMIRSVVSCTAAACKAGALVLLPPAAGGQLR
jgi:hypothetical protein